MALQDSQPEDIRATLAISAEEARLGASRVINLPGGRSATVTVPAGVRDGEELRLPGQGNASGSEGTSGDLILRISVITLEQFQEDLDDASITQAAYIPPLARPSSNYAAGASGYPPPASAPTEVAPGNPAPSPPPVYAQTPVGGPPSHPGAGSYQHYPDLNQAAQPQPSYLTYPPQAAPPQPRKRGGVITAAIVLLVLILLAASGLFFYFGSYQPNQIHANATATARTLAQGTANAQATGTAQVVQSTAQAISTSTAQAQATTTAQQNLYSQATSGTPVLSDPLSSQTGNQWDESNTTSGSCTFASGSYHSLMPTATFFQPCYAENTNFSNFTFQVDMTITQGDEGGILFRADSINNKFYLFQIDVTGNYALYMYISEHGSQATRLLRGSTTLMKGVGQLNEITLIAQGNTLSFYLNKQYLNAVNDGTYSSGKIGVFAESVTHATDVAFTNAKVWKL